MTGDDDLATRECHAVYTFLYNTVDAGKNAAGHIDLFGKCVPQPAFRDKDTASLRIFSCTYGKFSVGGSPSEKNFGGTLLHDGIVFIGDDYGLGFGGELFVFRDTIRRSEENKDFTGCFFKDFFGQLYLFFFIGEDGDDRLRAVRDDVYDTLYFFVGRLGIEATYILYRSILLQSFYEWLCVLLADRDDTESFFVEMRKRQYFFFVFEDGNGLRRKLPNDSPGFETVQVFR